LQTRLKTFFDVSRCNFKLRPIYAFYSLLYKCLRLQGFDVFKTFNCIKHSEI
jgi:hypothetical protein